MKQFIADKLIETFGRLELEMMLFILSPSSETEEEANKKFDIVIKDFRREAITHDRQKSIEAFEELKGACESMTSLERENMRRPLPSKIAELIVHGR